MAARAKAIASPPRTTARARMTAKATAGSRCSRPNAPTPAASGSPFNPLGITTGSRRSPAPDYSVGNRSMSNKPPFLGFGLGLRPQHHAEILEGSPQVDWFEVISENYMIEGGQPLRMLDRICERYPVVMHGVSLSIASTAPLDWEYLARLKKLAERVKPVWISDHLCWTGVHGMNLHDLLPVPYTKEALDHVVDRVSRVQDILERRLTLENVSSYVTFGQSEMTEWEFVSE